MSAGTVKEQDNMFFDNEVYYEQAPGWYHFTDADKRTRLTEADIMAMYGASQ